MSFTDKLRAEVRTVGLTTAFFAVWFYAMMLFKWLILAEYDIKLGGLSAALVGALIVAKVVLILEHVNLGEWIRERAAWIHIGLRTVFYTLGVFVVLLLEKSFEGRHEEGGFVPALIHVFEHRDVHHVWGTTICVFGALFVFNALSVIRAHLGNQGLLSVFARPVPEAPNHER